MDTKRKQQYEKNHRQVW